MDADFGSSNALPNGTPISLVYYSNSQPVALAATVTNEHPLILSTSDDSAAKLEPGFRALLILQEGANFSKAEAEITSCEQYAGGWRIEAGQFGWEEIDRRKYPRYTAELPVTVKAVLEREGTPALKYVSGKTVDISLGGAWLVSEDPLANNSLVEFQAELSNGHHLRTLAIIVWGQDQYNYGVEFVDYLGASRYYLHDYLAKAA